MDLPYGCRALLERTGKSYDILHFRSGALELGTAVIAKARDEQTAANLSKLAPSDPFGASALGSRLYTTEDVFKDVVLRDDERMSVTMDLTVSSDTEWHNTNVRINVWWKEDAQGGRFAFSFTPPVLVEDALEAVEWIEEQRADEDEDTVAEIPFGEKWQEYWKLLLRLGASIAPANARPEPIPMGEWQELWDNVEGQLPAQLRCLKGDRGERADVYFPMDRQPELSDLDNWSEYPYVVAIGQTIVASTDTLLNLLRENRGKDYTDREMPQYVGICMKVLQIRHFKEMAYAQTIRENITEAGCKLLFLAQDEQRFRVVIYVVRPEEQPFFIRVQSATAQAAELLRIAEPIYESIYFDAPEVVTEFELSPRTYSDHLFDHYTLVASCLYTTRRDADFVAQPIRALMEKGYSTDDDAYEAMRMPGDDYSLNRDAVRLAKIFRLEEELFDPWDDAEAMIRLGMFKYAHMLQALRSFAWCIMCLADRERRDLADYSFEELRELGEKILDKSFLMYHQYSYCASLCSQNDWHVFYVPDAYILNREADGTCEDLRLLCEKRERAGNLMTVVSASTAYDALKTRSVLEDIISYNEETLESLEALRQDLESLLPVMETIHDGFLAGRDRSKPLVGPLADVLNAWCALAVAAKEPFYSEEAAHTEEAGGGLQGPMRRPTDALEDSPVRKKKAQSVASGLAGTAAEDAGNVVRPQTPPSEAPAAQQGAASGDATADAEQKAEPQSRNARKKARLQAELRSLEEEMSALRGLFAGIRRKKLQKQADKLREELHALER